RNRLDTGLVIERDKEACEQDQDPGMQFPVSHRHAGRCPLPGESDDVFGADVGREYGGADGDETGVPAGEEIVDAVLVVTAVPPGDEADDREIDADDVPVECCY